MSFCTHTQSNMSVSTRTILDHLLTLSHSIFYLPQSNKMFCGCQINFLYFVLKFWSEGLHQDFFSFSKKEKVFPTIVAAFFDAFNRM